MAYTTVMDRAMDNRQGIADRVYSRPMAPHTQDIKRLRHWWSTLGTRTRGTVRDPNFWLPTYLPCEVARESIQRQIPESKPATVIPGVTHYGEQEAYAAMTLGFQLYDLSAFMNRVMGSRQYANSEYSKVGAL